MMNSDTCCCGSDFKRGLGHGYGHCHSKFFRRFPTKAEIREKLEEYRNRLEKELAGVGERIEELQNQ